MGSIHRIFYENLALILEATYVKKCKPPGTLLLARLVISFSTMIGGRRRTTS
jgi:hypothetical protein